MLPSGQPRRSAIMHSKSSPSPVESRYEYVSVSMPASWKMPKWVCQVTAGRYITASGRNLLQNSPARRRHPVPLMPWMEQIFPDCNGTLSSPKTRRACSLLNSGRPSRGRYSIVCGIHGYINDTRSNYFQSP